MDSFCDIMWTSHDKYHLADEVIPILILVF